MVGVDFDGRVPQFAGAGTDLGFAEPDHAFDPALPVELDGGVVAPATEAEVIDDLTCVVVRVGHRPTLFLGESCGDAYSLLRGSFTGPGNVRLAAFPSDPLFVGFAGRLRRCRRLAGLQPLNRDGRALPGEGLLIVGAQWQLDGLAGTQPDDLAFAAVSVAGGLGTGSGEHRGEAGDTEGYDG